MDASHKFTRVLQRKGVSQATLRVAVRARPLSKKERLGGARTVTKLVDSRCVCVMDPDEDEHANDPTRIGAAPRGTSSSSASSVVAGGVRKKERRYVFDAAFDGDASNETVYRETVAPLVRGVLRGINATVFAYGATGSGKTHTMVGDHVDPGLMVLSLRDAFRMIADDRELEGADHGVECSYTEVYNELVYDLLVPHSPALELREDPEKGPCVAGLTHVKVRDEGEIFELLRQGNARRKTEETGANATSSRSHAVLEIWITRSERNHHRRAYTTAKLALVDLAGAERASETNNRGQQLRDGANINRSLLSLANCINALGKRKKKGFVFVPFRDSKLTRILKDGLCGNSRTVMVATVSGSSMQYEHTVNTLKYADRAKEIKTHVQENRGTVETHIAEYQRMIDALQEERRDLRAEVERLKKNNGGGGAGGGANAAPQPVPHPQQHPHQRQGLTVEEVEAFAAELAEATEACAEAQRVLIARRDGGKKGAGGKKGVNEKGAGGDGAASKELIAARRAAEKLEMLGAPLGSGGGSSSSSTSSTAGGSSSSHGRGSGGSSSSSSFFGGSLFGRKSAATATSAANAAGSRARGSSPPELVSASDLALLHQRASSAVAADRDAARLEARDRLIADQRAAIAALTAALGGEREAETRVEMPRGVDSLADLDARCDDMGRAEEGLVTAGVGSPSVVRVEAEALARRARAADAASRAGSRAGTPPDPPQQSRARRRSGGPPEHHHHHQKRSANPIGSPAQMDQLEYAADALAETLKLGTLEGPSAEDDDAASPGASDSGEDDVIRPKEKTRASNTSSFPAKKALTPVPEREASNRGNVARGREEYNAWAAANASSKAREAPGARDAKGAAAPSRGVKPSPYALGGAAKPGAKKSSALARRLSRIRG